METFDLKRAFGSRGSLAACLCMLLISSASNAEEYAHPDRLPRPGLKSCVETATNADDLLWQAYRSCAVQADLRRVTGDTRSEFISSCTTRRAAAGDAKERDWTRDGSCYAKATASHLADERRRAFIDDCIASESNRAMTRLAEWSTGVHRR